MNQSLPILQDTALVLVCKRPALYQGKQRLAATLGAETALTVAELLLSCALEDAVSWPGSLVISPAHREDAIWANTLLDQDYYVIPQSEGNLGERLNRLDRDIRHLGIKNTLYIGSDAPLITINHLSDAARKLNTYDIVLNQASDGGVILMGCGKPWPELSHLPWSTSQLEQSLADLCRQSGLSVGYGTPGYDIDNQKDLTQLLKDLQQDRRPARQALVQLVTPLLNTGVPAHA
ncbi:MAG: TIGR04282 family arsenosugar biosynthesis glycosyltransferase [Endozoicomonas sp.]